MSDYIFQDHRGQSFEQAFFRGLEGTIIASGFEPRDRSYEGRFWWGVGETTDGTMEVFCGRVSNFQDGGWAYKIEGLEYWGGSDHNPPVNVRKAIVKHGLRVNGVYNPDSDNPKFALLTRETMVTTVSAAMLSGDDAYLLEAIACLGSVAAKAALDAFLEECHYAGRKPPKVSTAVLRAIAASADAANAKFLAFLMCENHVQFDAAAAELVCPLLTDFHHERLTKIFPQRSARKAV